MISPYQFFKIYSGVQLHFTSSGYDFYKYAGKSKTINKESFDNRRDKYRFIIWSQKIESPDDALKLCVFNFLYDTQWLYDSFDVAKERLLNKNKYYSTFTRNITKDYGILNQLKLSKQISFRELTEPTRSGNKPPILQLVLQNVISIEFCCMCNSINNFTDTWKSSLDPLVKEEANKICKYLNFMLQFSR
jgi:hypothetical protein